MELKIFSNILKILESLMRSMQSQSIKVLFILHFPPPVHGASMVGQYIKDSKYLAEKIEANYINLSTSDSIDAIGKGGIKKLVSILKVYLKSFIKLLTFRPHVCYITLTATGGGFYKDSIIALMAKILKVKTIYHLHNKGVKHFQNKTLDNFLYKLVFIQSKVILLSPLLYQDVEKYVQFENCYFCPNGIPDYYVPDNQIKKQNSPTLRLLFISNLIRSKGVLDVIEALALIKEKNFELSIVGAESDISSNELLKVIHFHHLDDKVRYMGKLYGEEKFNLLARSDVFVFPTYYSNECLPISILEAMCFGLPVISTFEGAIPDLVKNNETGLLIPSNQPKALAEAISKLLENVDLRNHMGEEGRKHFLNKFTLPVFECKMSEILIHSQN
jgi:glycosyltransferase involved in cell wall biosynthesis